MTRRKFFTGSVLAAGTLAFRSARASASELSLTVRVGERLSPIAPDFLGFGYEIASVGRPGLMSAANKVYVQLVRNLGARGVIRKIGRAHV